MVKRILITVPHAVCNQFTDENHQCDSLAHEFALNLEESFELNNIETKLLVGNIPRYTCDLNRVICENTEFVSRVKSEIKRTSLHLDIHSFPTSDENWRNYDVVLLVQNPKVISKVKNLSSYLNNRKVPTAIYPGVTNYLIEISQSFNVPSWLIEINEDTDSVEIADLIAEWFLL
jgi:hypothetical protein